MTTDSKYEKIALSTGETTFNTHPAKPPGNYGFAIFFGLMGLALASVGVGGKHGTSWGMVIFWLAVGGALACWSYTLDKRPKRHKQAYSFLVTATSIEADGTVTRFEEIDRLIVKNGMTNLAHSSPGVLVGGTGATGFAVVSSALAMNAAANAGAKIHQRHQEICHELVVESAGRATVLSAGLDETTAFGLMADVSRLLAARK